MGKKKKTAEKAQQEQARAERMRPLEEAAKFYGDARADLRSVATELEQQLAAIRDQYRDRIRALAMRAAEARLALDGRVKAAPELFEDPRSALCWGVRFGFRKQPGKVLFDDAETVCKRIAEQLPEHAGSLIRTRREPIKDGLRELTGAQLLALGVQLTADTDEAFISTPADELDKLIDALSGGEVVA